MEADPRGQFVTFFVHSVSTVHLTGALMRLGVIVMGDVTDIGLHSRFSGAAFCCWALGWFLLATVLCLMRHWALLYRCVSPNGVELRVQNSSTPQSLKRNQIVFPKGCTGFEFPHFCHSLLLCVFGIIIPASCTCHFSTAETEHWNQGHQKVSAHDGKESIVPGSQSRKLRFSVFTTNKSTENKMKARQSHPWNLPKQRHRLGSKCSNVWVYVGRFSPPHKSSV